MSNRYFIARLFGNFWAVVEAADVSPETHSIKGYIVSSDMLSLTTAVLECNRLNGRKG